jgi:lipoic acid synthetase
MTRLPHWLRRRHSLSELHQLKGMLRSHGLSTVCEEARCPNKAECFSKPTATFMILGSSCTRNCGFCSVTSARPMPPEEEEPRRVAMASKEMALRYVVLTSVTRDDLPDQGAGQFARTIREIRRGLSDAGVEVLTPDFGGRRELLETVLNAGPDVFNHNVETVPRLYGTVRPQADYARSIGLLALAGKISPDVKTKSGLMLGLGEELDEVREVLKDLRGAGVELLTIGQYLRPAKENLPVVEYVEPAVFDGLREEALEMGFSFVASGPFVRSSMNAEEMYSHGRKGTDVSV